MSLDVSIEKDALMYSRKEIDDKVKEGKEKSIKIIDEAAGDYADDPGAFGRTYLYPMIHLNTSGNFNSIDLLDNITLDAVTVILVNANGRNAGDAAVYTSSPRNPLVVGRGAGVVSITSDEYKFSPTAILKFLLENSQETANRDPQMSVNGKLAKAVIAPTIIGIDNDCYFYCDIDAPQIKISNDGSVNFCPLPGSNEHNPQYVPHGYSNFSSVPFIPMSVFQKLAFKLAHPDYPF